MALYPEISFKPNILNLVSIKSKHMNLNIHLPFEAGVLGAVEDLVLALAAGSAGLAVDAVETVVLGDSVGVVQSGLPRGGAVVFGTLDGRSSRVALLRRAVPSGKVTADRLLDPGDHHGCSSRVRVLPGRRAHHGCALLQFAGHAIIALLAAGLAGRWLVLGRQHVRQHCSVFLHLDTEGFIQDRTGSR